MEFGQAKKLIAKSIQAAGKECSRILGEYGKEDLIDQCQYACALIDKSKNRNAFLEGVTQLYNVIEVLSKEAAYSPAQAEAMKTVMANLTLAVIGLLARMYGPDGYERELLQMEEFDNLLSTGLFSIGVFIIKEETSSLRTRGTSLKPPSGDFVIEDEMPSWTGGRCLKLPLNVFISEDGMSSLLDCEEGGLPSIGGDDRGEPPGKGQAAWFVMLNFINYLTSSDGKYRNILYEKLTVSAPWVIDSGLLTRDVYISILLRFFRPEDENAAFIRTVYRLISPRQGEDPAVEDRVDQVIIESFGVLTDDLKKEIIERCTYRTLSGEGQASGRSDIEADACPRKVLERVMRRHVCSMLKTQWKDPENWGAAQRQQLKYNCLDCAYVSARLKELIDPDYWNKDEADRFGSDEIRDSHDQGQRESRNFNIVLSGVHVLLMHLEEERVTIRFYNNTADGGRPEELAASGCPVTDQENEGTPATEGGDRIVEGEAAAEAAGRRDEGTPAMEAAGRRDEGTPATEGAYRTEDGQYAVAVPFSIDDWELTVLDAALKRCAILEKARAYSHQPKGSDFHYSLIYLENYRGIDRICVPFDHRYHFWRKKDAVGLEREETDGLIPHYYGKSILSMSSFVGKNGAGKTSIVDFLRDSFLHICHDLYYENLVSAEGVIDIAPSAMERYRLKPDEMGARGQAVCGTRFFIVFHFNGKDYYLTNLNLGTGDRVGPSGAGDKALTFVNAAGAAPYEVGKCLPLYSGNRKLLYFSQFLPPAGVADEERRLYRVEGLPQEGGLAPARGGSGAADWEAGTIDLSEGFFNRLRQPLRPGEPVRVNSSLIMQLLLCCEGDLLKAYFQEDFSVNELEVRSHRLGETGAVKVVTLNGVRLETVLTDPMAYIRPFSSGQYSKFVLLSRLYWCIEGWKHFPEVFAERSGKDTVALEANLLRQLTWTEIRDEFVGHYLRETDSAVLFFDEADTYYHPDWQRGFVQDVVSMIERYRRIPVQVVFTTNSPLMLSDLRQMDIYLMKDDGRRRPAGRAGGPGLAGPWNPSIPTFGQNIHTLMAKPFFLNRTIGRFADQRIEWLVGLLTDTTEIVAYLKEKEDEEEAHEENADKPTSRQEEKEHGEEEDKSASRLKEKAPKENNEILAALREKHEGIYEKVVFILKAMSKQPLDTVAGHEQASAARHEADAAKGRKQASAARHEADAASGRKQDTAPMSDRSARRRQRDIASRAEKEFVMSEIKEQFFTEAGAGTSVSFAEVEAVLVNQIKLIGEAVLKNELMEMYNDFISRVESSMALEKLIEKRRKELRRLEEKRSRLDQG